MRGAVVWRLSAGDRTIEHTVSRSRRYGVILASRLLALHICRRSCRV